MPPISGWNPISKKLQTTPITEPTISGLVTIALKTGTSLTGPSAATSENISMQSKFSNGTMMATAIAVSDSP